MANLLKMAIIDTIFTLKRRGWSQRRIARELGIHRETVARQLRIAQQAAKPANAPVGSEPDSHPVGPALGGSGQRRYQGTSFSVSMTRWLAAR